MAYLARNVTGIIIQTRVPPIRVTDLKLNFCTWSSEQRINRRKEMYNIIQFNQ